MNRLTKRSIFILIIYLALTYVSQNTLLKKEKEKEKEKRERENNTCRKSITKLKVVSI